VILVPVPAQLTAVLSAYARLWQPAATDADIDAVLAPGFTDYRPGSDGAGAAEFREHRAMALHALKNLSVRYQPIAAAGSRHRDNGGSGVSRLLVADRRAQGGNRAGSCPTRGRQRPDWLRAPAVRDGLLGASRRNARMVAGGQEQAR
jgi:hypothetical protein